MGEQLPAETVNDLMTDLRRGVDLEIRTGAVGQRDEGDGGGQNNEGQGRSASDEASQEGQRRRQRAFEKEVVEDDLQGPGCGEVGDRDTDQADRGHAQPELHARESVYDESPEPRARRHRVAHRRAPWTRIGAGAATPAGTGQSSGPRWIIFMHGWGPGTISFTRAIFRAPVAIRSEVSVRISTPPDRPRSPGEGCARRGGRRRDPAPAPIEALWLIACARGRWQGDDDGVAQRRPRNRRGTPRRGAPPSPRGGARNPARRETSPR